jgi:serine protease Do
MVALLLAGVVLANSVQHSPQTQGSLLQAVEAELASLTELVRRSVVIIEDGRRLSSSVNLEERALTLSRLQVYAELLNQREKQAERAVDKGTLTAAEIEKQSAEVSSALKAEADLLAVLPKSGTGFSIGNRYILTTADVLQGMESPVIVTEDGRRLSAQPVAVDPLINLGVLRITAGAVIPSVRWGSSAAVKMGQFAVAVGNLGSGEHSVSIGTVSSVKADPLFSNERLMPGLIQISGAVGGGSSGAPVFNSRGEVIGIVAAVPVFDVVGWASGATTASPAAPPQSGGKSSASQTTQNAGAASKPSGSKDMRGDAPSAVQTMRSPRVFSSAVAYAIPSDGVRQFVEELTGQKSVVRGWLGVYPAQEVRRTDSKGEIVLQSVVYLMGVLENSPAWAAGVRPGDEIAKLNDRPVHTLADLRNFTSRIRAGEKVRCELVRMGAPMQVQITVAARPAVIEQKPVLARPLRTDAQGTAGRTKPAVPRDTKNP